MEEEHRNILRKHREALIRDLEPLKLLNRLDVLGDDDRELVKAKKTRSEQAEELLDMLPRKGEDAFQNFITALCNGSQKFLAKPLIRASGMDESSLLKDEVGMTEEHKRVLRTSSDQFSSMDIKKLLPHLTKVLDEYDKQELQSDQKSNCTRMDQLLTEILPKKGPEAFRNFVKAVEKVDLPLAKKIQESGREGSPNDDKSSTHTGSIQETSVYSLKSEVQDIIDELPEVFKKFCMEMDKEIFGNGWKRLFKELGLPAGGEPFVEKEPGSHTLNVIKGWISYYGSRATVQTLLDAVNRSQRKDCVPYILNPLNLGQEYVDSPVNDMTKKFESLRSPNDDKSSTHIGSIQETSVYSLKSEVQDILDEQPEVFGKFCKEMDKEIFGNGWKRLFKELGLPAEGESFVEKEPGSHTLNVIKGWISYYGSGATVQTLLDAVNRSQRKDCVRYLLKPLNLGQDNVDSPVNDMTKKFESLSE